MQTLFANKKKIFEIKNKVENKDISLYNHTEIQNIPIADNTITIVMTSCNRSIQTYFTLKTIQNSSFKNIHIILVDDSDEDPIIKEELEKYPFYIDFIEIKRENKEWINPVINYNIGFQYIKGCKVIIQNAEVCHVGDVLGYMETQILDENYYICDVKALLSLEKNNIIYNTENLTTEIYNNNELFGKWYQGKERLVNYHFLSGMTKNTFDKVKNFSYDYTFGFSYDDNDFLLKIISNKINIINLFHDEYNIGGIHLWHKSYFKKKGERNKNIYYIKKNEYDTFGNYLDILYIKDINIKMNKKLNLLEIQDLLIKFTGLKIINFYIDKKNMTKQINTFRKSYMKGYCYKNSEIKIPKNLFINFYYI